MPPNWSLLVEQGRAKAIGVAWSEEELHAIYELKIPYIFVREGCLTKEQYEQLLAETSVDRVKEIRTMRKEQLLLEAKSLGIEVSNEVTRTDLIDLITQKITKP